MPARPVAAAAQMTGVDHRAAVLHIISSKGKSSHTISAMTTAVAGSMLERNPREV
jgi:hypothetical protein